MQIQKVKDKNLWHEEATGQGSVDLLQSWKYGEFLQSMGREVLRLKTGAGDQAQCIIYHLPFGFRYAYLPRVSLAQNAVEHVLAYLWSQGMSFVRLEPKHPIERMQKWGHIYPAKNAQAQYVWLLDVRPPIASILTAMHQKTRYNIRTAQRHGIAIREEKNFEVFWALNEETTLRNRYSNNPKEFCRRFIDTMATTQLTAWHDATPIATAVLLRYRDTMIYFYGASGTKGRETMAPTLLQWHAIQYAKSAGCSFYDFLGIARTKKEGDRDPISCFHHLCWDPTHMYSGVTRFKAGFGGFAQAFPDAFDIVKSFPGYLISRAQCMCRRKGN